MNLLELAKARSQAHTNSGWLGSKADEVTARNRWTAPAQYVDGGGLHSAYRDARGRFAPAPKSWEMPVRRYINSPAHSSRLNTFGLGGMGRARGNSAPAPIPAPIPAPSVGSPQRGGWGGGMRGWGSGPHKITPFGGVPHSGAALPIRGFALTSSNLNLVRYGGMGVAAAGMMGTYNNLRDGRYGRAAMAAGVGYAGAMAFTNPGRVANMANSMLGRVAGSAEKAMNLKIVQKMGARFGGLIH